MSLDRAEAVRRICWSVGNGDLRNAAATVRAEYPLVVRLPVGRNYDEITSTRIFARDGFIDRYTGDRVVFPGVLRLLSSVLPEEFPFHPNWKVSETHPAYWELFPTLDHVVPLARGGSDEEPNMVTTSMLRNSAKAHWSLEDLGWSLHPPGSLAEWDGMTSWFVQRLNDDPSYLTNGYLRRWHRAAAVVTSHTHIHGGS